MPTCDLTPTYFFSSLVTRINLTHKTKIAIDFCVFFPLLCGFEYLTSNSLSRIWNKNISYLSPNHLEWIHNMDEFPTGLIQILFHKIPFFWKQPFLFPQDSRDRQEIIFVKQYININYLKNLKLSSIQLHN